MTALPCPPPAARRRPLDARLRRWLQATGSLTVRLQQAFGPVRVQRLRQGGELLRMPERAALGPHAPCHGHRREVLLHAGAQPLVYARSTLATPDAHGRWRAIRGLGSRPLAELLYTRRDVQRSRLVLRFLAPADPVNRRIRREWRAACGTDLPGRGLWTRASVFRRAGRPLRVMEAFSPAVRAAAPGRIRRR